MKTEFYSIAMVQRTFLILLLTFVFTALRLPAQSIYAHKEVIDPGLNLFCAHIFIGQISNVLEVCFVVESGSAFDLHDYDLSGSFFNWDHAASITMTKLSSSAVRLQLRRTTPISGSGMLLKAPGIGVVDNLDLRVSNISIAGGT